MATSWGGGQRRFSAGTPGSGGATGAEQDREAAQGGGWGLQGVAWDFLFPVKIARRPCGSLTSGEHSQLCFCSGSMTERAKVQVETSFITATA